LVLARPALARADGQPVLGYAGPPGLLRSADSTHRYLARPNRDGTLVEAVSPTGTLAYTISGSFAIPMVAFDGSLGGLSANGHTLVLQRPRTAFPARSSDLAVLDADKLRVRRLVHLRGDFSFDAISPNGRWVYLIQYTATSAFQYRVRALATRSGLLLAHAIIDPHDRGEKMQGYPVTRLSSRNGRWAYTLYAGSTMPFIHALDTFRLRARCIDLPTSVQTLNTILLRLRLTGHLLVVRIGRRTLSALDTRSLRLIPVPVRPRAAKVRHSAETAASTTPQFGVAAAMLLAAVALLVRRRRSRAA
jgi:MYXO-CTERM domain-containing protein